ncbi:argininosuccinate synthase, partial [Bacillus thuringiensis]|nr:argininosuccinate synthase [Bacillus thuringiensis]
FKQNHPITLNNKTFTNNIKIILKTNNINNHHNLNINNQIKNQIIKTKNHNIYKTPKITLLHITYKHLLTNIHNKNTIKQYHTHNH